MKISSIFTIKGKIFVEFNTTATEGRKNYPAISLESIR